MHNNNKVQIAITINCILSADCSHVVACTTQSRALECIECDPTDYIFAIFF